MKLTVKTLKGEKFQVEVEDTKTVADVKGVIETTKSELPAAGMKLIHSGKVLKETETISACGIKPNDFLVVMVTKAKKPAVAPVAAAAATPAAPAAADAAAATQETKTPAAAPAPDASAAVLDAVAPPAPSRPTEDNFSAEAVENLTAMGFPEAEVRHCLRVAQGNPDIAVEFLTNGIPESVQQVASADGAASSSPTAAATSASSSGGGTLQALRNHPQFNDLRRLVQSNPNMLQQVLTQIGQQQPELLREINANQGLFLQMMNEPVTASSPSSGGGGGTSGSSSSPSGGAGGGFGALGNPGQMAQMIQNMSGEEVNQMAAMMGISPDQLRQTAQMIGQMPPEQLNQFMMQAMGGGGDGDALAGLMGGGGGGMMGGGGGGHVLHFTEEEMAAVDRLTDLGFDRSEAAQAFLACDKNEALAANLLMDSMDGSGGAFGFGGGGDDNGNGGGGNNDGNGDDDGDDMYD